MVRAEAAARVTEGRRARPCRVLLVDETSIRRREGQFVGLSDGGWHTCGLRTDATIDCWGSYQQLAVLWS